MDPRGTFARQLIGWLLIAAFGPAPIASAFAVSGAPDCRMACCKRTHHRQSCDRHNETDSPSMAPFEICGAQCSQGAAGLGAAPVLLSPSASREIYAAIGEKFVSTSAPPVASFADPIRHQRPPPLFAR
jgi:hypothetical protein